MKISAYVYKPFENQFQIDIQFIAQTKYTFEDNLINTLKYLVDKYKHIHNSRFLVLDDFYRNSFVIFAVVSISEKLLQITFTVNNSNKILLFEGISTNTENSDITKLSISTKNYALVTQINYWIYYDYREAHKLIDILILNYGGPLYELFERDKIPIDNLYYFICYTTTQKYRKLTDADYDYIMSNHFWLANRNHKAYIENAVCPECEKGIKWFENYLVCENCIVAHEIKRETCPKCGLRNTYDNLICYTCHQQDKINKHNEHIAQVRRNLVNN
jgi:hypothetical protein